MSKIVKIKKLIEIIYFGDCKDTYTQFLEKMRMLLGSVKSKVFKISIITDHLFLGNFEDEQVSRHQSH